MSNLFEKSSVPLAFDRYLAIKREFAEMAQPVSDWILTKMTSEEFVLARRMSKNASLPEGISAWGKRIGRASLECVVEKGVSTLTEQGCYSIDAEQYERNYLDLTEINACADSSSSMQALQKLESEEINRESARQARTSRMRNMWVGGTLGGGIKGALKGALKAEIMNAGGALISGVANRIGRAHSREEMVKQSSQLFTCFCRELAEAAQLSVRANVDGYVRCLNDNLDEKISCRWPGRDVAAAKGLLRNLSQGRIPATRREDTIRVLLRLDPLCSESYDWIYRHEPQFCKELEMLARYFCVEVNAIKEETAHQAAVGEVKRKRQEEQRRTSQKATNVDVIKEMVLKAVSESGGDLYCNPNISEKKLINAKAAMSVPPEEMVFALMDTTLFGSAKTGAVLTSWGIRWANDWTTDSAVTSMSWGDLKAKSLSISGEYNLKLCKNAVINTAGGRITPRQLAKVIKSIVENLG